MNDINNSHRPHLIVVGGGSAGIGVIASIKKRIKNLKITLIEPKKEHDYQPAWTLVGAGLYSAEKTRRRMDDVIPADVFWVNDAVTHISPDLKYIETTSAKKIHYDFLIIASGLVLRWDKINGLNDTLGRNGVTSNYRYDLASYTWELVQNLKQGKALFTQPDMPIKCAGAPQKVLYLSADYWQRRGRLAQINIQFCLAGQAIFGVSEFVPPLKACLEKYQAQVNFGHTLTRVDGVNKQATFTLTASDSSTREVTLPFDMLHVVPPQAAPAFIAESGLADGAGWCDVDKETLQHSRWPDIFSLGDCCSTPNAKTAAAARKQIVVVAENLRQVMNGEMPKTRYDGYGSCPLTVEKGKVVLAEFGYGNRLLPTFPLHTARPSRVAWWLKAWFLPRFYWAGMLRGIEWFAKSKPL
ncbi:NAD(P)/FAD-dependent oxidoreductase [Pantoea stewartii]|uniref:NAD(P)/FAD-dependent oxidoreductase n=1 Tax=Pantoea stewartii TaxID=66269 RepID=UPI002DBA1D3F|nr:FAD/NAD(P)-binding oxidoreductase [Pantoea stewartii]MEB6537092.1 NAD(P)/FAD-dependent oxidoreductase [Pantoea stewartii]